MIVDTFMINDEFDMLECRLVEIGHLVDLVVAVEADVDHQGNPKPYHLSEAADDPRWARWVDKLRIVRAAELPSVAEDPDPWSREHAQREHTFGALDGLAPDTIVLHGDVDEIPTRLFVRHVRPDGLVVAGMWFHPFAVDWLHPQVWPGTVAGRLGKIRSFTEMRDARFTAPRIDRSGWHFSWVGDVDYRLRKLDAFAHPEIKPRVSDALARGEFERDGWHVDGHKLTAVTVDEGWPEWIRERRCPADWFRHE